MHEAKEKREKTTEKEKDCNNNASWLCVILLCSLLHFLLSHPTWKILIIEKSTYFPEPHSLRTIHYVFLASHSLTFINLHKWNYLPTAHAHPYIPAFLSTFLLVSYEIFSFSGCVFLHPLSSRIFCYYITFFFLLAHQTLSSEYCLQEYP